MLLIELILCAKKEFATIFESSLEKIFIYMIFSLGIQLSYRFLSKFTAFRWISSVFSPEFANLSNFYGKFTYFRSKLGPETGDPVQLSLFIEKPIKTQKNNKYLPQGTRDLTKPRTFPCFLWTSVGFLWGFPWWICTCSRELWTFPR